MNDFTLLFTEKKYIFVNMELPESLLRLLRDNGQRYGVFEDGNPTEEEHVRRAIDRLFKDFKK